MPKKGETAMGKNVAQKLIEAHLIDGSMQPGEEIGLKICLQQIVIDVLG